MNSNLDPGTTYKAIVEAAKQRRFLSYGDVAKGNNAYWNSVRHMMSDHLAELLAISYEREWPALAVIVVNKENLDDGQFEPAAEAKLIEAADDAGYEVEDPESFVKQQQEAVFSWAKNASIYFIESGIPMPDTHARLMEYMGPVLEIVKEQNGSAHVNDIMSLLQSKLVIPTDETNRTYQNGRTPFEGHVRKAGTFLKRLGLVERLRGVWTLTEKGKHSRLDTASAKQLVSEWRAKRRQDRALGEQTATNRRQNTEGNDENDSMTSSIPPNLDSDAVQEDLATLLTRFGSIYPELRRTQPFGMHPETWQILGKVTNSFHTAIQDLSGSSKIKIKWSLGNGNWAHIPWFAFMHSDETQSTQQGMYAVYLFAEDMSAVSLCLALGATQFTKKYPRKDALQRIAEKCQEYAGYFSELDEHGFHFDGTPKLGADGNLGKSYEYGNILWKSYDFDNLPPQEILFSDLHHLLERYIAFIAETGGTEILGTSDQSQRVWAIGLGEQSEFFEELYK